MKSNGMNRVPHVIGKKILHNGNREKDSIYIIGKTDQIDGQAHNILAWAKLALARGQTLFEDSTWNFVSDLMDRSTEEPYFGSNKNSFIPDLIYNFNFEHSRPIPTNYDLLTQCFVGSALASMIKVAVRRNDITKAKRWTERLNRLKLGIGKYMTREIDGKQVYLELLSKEKNINKPFLGYSWVNLSPIAAQWSPLNFEVLHNTFVEMEKQTVQEWNNLKWMPTEWWPNGDFSGQIIGKGIGWEIEFCRAENDWDRMFEILSMIEAVQKDEPIFMENSYLTIGSKNFTQRMNKDDLQKMNYGVWKIVDPGNGEQAAWWCWAIARLRIGLGLSAVPEKLCTIPEIHIEEENQNSAMIEITRQSGSFIFYTIDGSIPGKKSIPYNGSFFIRKPIKINAVAYNNNGTVSNIKSLIVPSVYNSLEYLCFPNINANSNFKWSKDTPSFTGYTANFNINNLSSLNDKFGIIHKGYLKIGTEDEYNFFVITLNHSRLYIDGELISSDINSLTKKNSIKTIQLKKGYHQLILESECSPLNNNIDIYFSRNNGPKKLVDSSMLSAKIPKDSTILPPQILPFKPEFDIDDSLTVTINSFDNSEVFYTLDGSNPTKNSLKYENPIKINSSLTVKAVSISGKQISSVSIMKYKQTEKTKIDLKFQPSSKYHAMGEASLIDGIFGSTNLNDGNWLGFEGDDFDAAIDLRKIKKVKEIKTDFLNNPGSWIFLPSTIKIFISSDDKNFEEVYAANPDSINQHSKVSEKKEFSIQLKNKEVRFIRILGKNIGICPKWHPGDGNKAWIFVDEITIN